MPIIVDGDCTQEQIDVKRQVKRKRVGHADNGGQSRVACSVPGLMEGHLVTRRRPPRLTGGVREGGVGCLGVHNLQEVGRRGEGENNTH